MNSLLDLLEVHSSLREKFALHRDLVVGLAFGKALGALEAFERDLRSHMELEERHVMPLYEERVGHVLGGDPQFFYLEHKNILRNPERAKESLRKLAADARAGCRQAHEFIQEENILYHVMEHHDLREKNILYPCLDQKLSPEERSSLLTALRETAQDAGDERTSKPHRS